VGVVQTKRRTWDEEEYRIKAEDRAKRESEGKKPTGEFRTSCRGLANSYMAKNLPFEALSQN
jgi:hypothetical protein